MSLPGDSRRCMKDSLPRAVACVCLCVDERFPPPPLAFLHVDFLSKYRRGMYQGVVSHGCRTHLCQ